MAPEQDLNFDFDFGGETRQEIFGETIETLKALDLPLGPALSNPESTGAALTPEEQAAAHLLQQLDIHVAELGASPQVVELSASQFQLYGWDTPKQFRELSKTQRFYWMQVPVFLSQLENMPFSKLELAIEFNPAEAQGERKPISVLIFPDKRVKQLAHFEQGASLKVGENFELEVATPKVDLTAGEAKAKGQAGVNLGASGGFNLALGPFAYDLKKLELEHTDTGNSKVFWKVFTAKYLHEQRPTFIVVFQVPRQVEVLKVAAAMQAYHQFDVGAAGLGQVLDVLREKVANFFRSGAPLKATQVWDLSTKLAPNP